MPAPRPDFRQQFQSVQDLLACPACQGELRLEGQRVACPQCARSYPVVDGIPVLIPE